MVGNMIRVLRARMTLLVVDESGVSPVDYTTVDTGGSLTNLDAVDIATHADLTELLLDSDYLAPGASGDIKVVRHERRG